MDVLCGLSDPPIPRRSWYDLEEGVARLDLETITRVARALDLDLIELLAPLFPPRKPPKTTERSDVDRRWAAAILQDVERSARSYRLPIDNPWGRAVIAAVSIIARCAPEELPVIARVLGSRASDLELSLADRIRAMQHEADSKTPDQWRKQTEAIEAMREGDGDVN